MSDLVHNFIENDGVRLCLERRGVGARHVLFAHGWISGRRMWYDVAQRLDPDKFTLHLLDFRGAGLSDRPMTGHDLDGYASDLRAALRAIDAPVTLVGHSMGGKISQFIACERPANLKRMVLVAPGTARSVRLSERHRQLSLEAFGVRKRIERFQRAAMARETPYNSMQRIVDDALVGQREAWFGWYERGRAVDFFERLKAIVVPTLAIAGEKDPLTPPSRIKRDVSAAIAGCALVMLKNAGHNLPVETPDEIASAIDKFGI
ncbi:MAG: alpha/beta hydrolase [Candidatus Eremiobacteraeota bacterium]|nr:alpha/beta hydrolase [Candidatus Eremiobacteraeota bacterium]